MAIGGARPKTAEAKRIEGNRGHRQIVERGLTVKSAIPVIPKELGKDAKKEWKRITKELNNAGLISNLDLAVLSTYCIAWGRVLEVERLINDTSITELAEERGSTYERLLNQSYKLSEQLRKLAAELGLSPGARVRVQPTKKVADESAAKQFFDA